MTRDLAAWLALIEKRHPRNIQLGLDRCAVVRDRLGWGRLPFPVITVSGTNGKGSAVAYLESMLLAAGYGTGAYTSPHLHRYNERVRLNGVAADDRTLCAGFERVEQAREATPLTYFETGTLGAMAVFLDARPDVVILEVGLGGRLDAVNLFDADAALVTSVDRDHRDWLGDDPMVIGREKAGIFRPGRPAVCADPDAPASVAAAAAAVGARFILAGRDYRWRVRAGGWDWAGGAVCLDDLPLPALAGRHQVRNAAAVIALLNSMSGPLQVPVTALVEGLRAARLEGRLELRDGAVRWLYDVAHNAEAARALAEFLERLEPQPARILAIFAMLIDKDVHAAVTAVAPFVDGWWIPQLDTPRAAPAEVLESVVEVVCPGVPVSRYGSPREALNNLSAELRPGDLVVVFGSFVTVAEVRRLESSASTPDTPPHG